MLRGVAVSLALGKLACSPAAPLPAEVPPPAKSSAPVVVATATAAPVVTAEPAPAIPPDPSARLAGYAVTNASFARRVLYTWTSEEQIDELASKHVLLSRSESPKYGKSFYDRKMEERWMAGDKLAALLRAPAFLKARFAWTAPWATLLGWPGESYGGQLIEVTLKPDAWIVMFRTATSSWEGRDLSGAVVPMEKLLKRPDRIAAIHFVHDAVVPPPATGAAPARVSAPDGRDAYREYVLCNESMVESWAIGTERIQAEIQAGAEILEATAKFFAVQPPPVQRSDRWNAHVALIVWPGLVEVSNAKEAYEAALAFPNTNYAIDPQQIRAIATALRGISQRAKSTVWKPTSVFPGARPVPIPPPPPVPPVSQRRKYYGTFY